MSFVVTTPNELHTIDVNDPSDPSLVPPEIDQKSEGGEETDQLESAQEPSLVVNMIKDAGDESSESEYEGSDDGDGSDDDSSDESESSEDDGSDDDGSDDDQSDADAPFEYHEVIDDASKSTHDDIVHEEDLGGEAMATASAIAGVSVMSGFRGKRTLIIGVVLAAITACAMYFIWRKMQDMKKKISQLEQQQEMGLNDRDVQLISSQVLQDYLQQEPEEESEPRRGGVERLETIPEYPDAAEGKTHLRTDHPERVSTPAAAEAPVEMAEPAVPEAPVAAEDPVAPVAPEAPVEISEPEAPDAPVEMAEPAAHEAPVTPEAPVEMSEPAASVTSEEPVEMAEPAAPEAPVAPDAPVEAAGPVAPEEPLDGPDEPDKRQPLPPRVIDEDVPVQEPPTKRRSRRTKAGVDSTK